MHFVSISKWYIRIMHAEKVKKILSHIKLRRIELEYTQKQVADKLNINQNMYSKIEKNQVRLTSEVFLLVCDALDIDACELLRSV